MSFTRAFSPLVAIVLLVPLVSCRGGADSGPPAAASAGGAASVKDDVSSPDVVKVAVGSADHSTLVAALQAAGLVDVMSSSGPYTVFAPTNAAFDALPPGTVAELLKPANKSRLSKILQHHVTTSALDLDFFADGQSISMVDGGGISTIFEHPIQWPAVVAWIAKRAEPGDEFSDPAVVLFQPLRPTPGPTSSATRNRMCRNASVAEKVS